MALSAPELPDQYDEPPHDDSELRDDSQYRDNSGGSATSRAADRWGNAGVHQGGGEGDGKPSGDLQSAGGASRDKAAAGRAGGAAGKSGATGGGSALAGAAGGLAGRSGGLSSRLKKRLVIAIASAVVSLLIGILSFFGFLALKIIHFEEDVVHAIDKRMEHTLKDRLTTGWKAVRNRNAKSANGDHPLEDAYANVDTATLETDLGAKIETGGDGKWSDLVTADGEKIPADDAALDNPDSPIEQKLGARFSVMDFYHLNIRSRIIDSNFGILRKFLANRDEPVPSDEATLDKNLQDDLKARIEGTDSTTPENSEVTQEEDAAKTEVGNGSDSAKLGSDEGALVGDVVLACSAQQILDAVSKYGALIRMASLMRYSFVILSTADQLKTGNLHPSQLAAFMPLLSGFEKSGGWQRTTGQNKKAPIADLDQLSLNPTKGNTISQAVSTVNGAVSHIPLFGTVCSAVTSKAGQILGIGAAIIQLIGSDGLSEAAAVVGKFAVFQGVVTALTQIGENLVNNTFLSGTMPAAKVADATIAGYDSYSNINSRGSGGQRLTPQQVAILDNEANADDHSQAMRRSVAYRLLSPSYDQSLVSRLLDASPTTPTQFADAFTTKLSAIFNPFNRSQILAFEGFASGSSSSTAYADNYAGDQEDPTGFGVPQYGFPDSLLQQYPDPKANEDVVISYLASKGQTLFDPGTPSSSELTDQNNAHNDDYHNFITECLTEVDPTKVMNDSTCSSSGPGNIYDRFRVYRLDLFVANYITSNNNSNNDQNPNASGGGATPGGGANTSGAIDPSTLYADSSSIACATGTKDLGIGDGYHDSILTKIRLCALPNLPSTGTSVPNAGGLAVVNSRVSANWFALVQAAKQANIAISATSSFRTMADQQAQCPCDGVSAAIPGTSNHQMGLAIDFSVGGKCPVSNGSSCSAPASPTWNWLNQNAAAFGMHQYSAEAWHWSPTGN